MKLRYLFASLAAVVTLFTSCNDKYETLTLGEIQVSTSYVSIPVAGGKASVTVTTQDAWTLTCCDTCQVLNQNHTNAKGKALAAMNWLKADVTSGNAGTSTITFSADETLDGRTMELFLKSGGKVQRINVIQGLSTVSSATCAEVIAGPDSKTYRTKGVVTAIANTTYGNFYINDGTGEVYIYGTLYDGKEQNNPIVNNKIEVGDEVTVEGPKTTYNGTVELVNVTVVNVSKSLVKIDCLTVGKDSTDTLPIEGGEIVAHVTCKGEGIMAEVPEDAKSWLSISAVTGGSVTYRALPNEGGDRSAVITIQTVQGNKLYESSTTIYQKGAVVQLSCADFNAQADGTAQYKVHGIITKIANDKYGNLYINDGTGEVYVYGITGWNAADYKVGDEVVLQSVKTSYKGAAQMKNAVVVEKVAHDTKSVAELKALSDDKTTYYYVTGTVCHAEEESAKFDLEKYGNFGLKDETGTIYVYGLADGLDGKTQNCAATGIQEGDNITILAYKTSYKGTIELVGKFIKKN